MIRGLWILFFRFHCHRRQLLVEQIYHRLFQFCCSFECGGRKGSDADQLGSGRNSAEGNRRQHQLVLQCGHLHPDQGRARAVVVRELTGAVHGTARQAGLR